MSDNAKNLPAAPPLPGNMVDLMAQRKRPIVSSLNDEVERIHLALMFDETRGERYQQLLEPIWREQTKEGSFPMDDGEIARLFRDYAKEHRLPITANSNLASIVHSVNVVRVRYKLDRKFRQNMVGGHTANNYTQQAAD